MVSVTWLEGFDPSYVFKSKSEFKDWLLSHIDLAYLQPYLPGGKLKDFIEKSLKYGFKRVCIPPAVIENARAFLGGNGLMFIAPPPSFHGDMHSLEGKMHDCSYAISLKTDEIEFSPNLSLLGDIDQFKEESKRIISLIKSNGIVSKAYLEIEMLPDDQLKSALDAEQELMPDYIGVAVNFLDEETYEGENFNIASGLFSKINAAMGGDKKTGLKVYGKIDSINAILSILFLATKYGWALEDLRIGTEYGFEIMDNFNDSDY